MLRSNSDGTVTDTLTGLVWAQDCPTEPMNWHSAKQYCRKLTLAGKSNWRLPTQNELYGLYRSLQPYELSGYENCGVRDSGPFCWYGLSSLWSSTESKEDRSKAFKLPFKNGQRLWTDDKSSKSNYVRAVRSPLFRRTRCVLGWLAGVLRLKRDS